MSDPAPDTVAAHCSCGDEASYLAQTTYTLRPRKLCGECGAEDRALGDVIWIKRIACGKAAR